MFHKWREKANCEGDLGMASLLLYLQGLEHVWYIHIGLMNDQITFLRSVRFKTGTPFMVISIPLPPAIPVL